MNILDDIKFWGFGAAMFTPCAWASETRVPTLTTEPLTDLSFKYNMVVL